MHTQLVNPTTGEVKSVKNGFSWTLFFLSPFYGIPLFVRGLHLHGAAVALVGILALLLTDSPLLPLAGLLLLAAMFFYGVKGNELTIQNFLRKGWQERSNNSHRLIEPAAVPSSAADQRTNPESNLTLGEKTCPRCAETIKAAAHVCKHCGHEFDATRAADWPVQSNGTGRGALIAVVILGLVLVAVIVASEENAYAVTDVDSGSDDIAFESPPMAVTARELFQAYQANEQAAQMKFGGQPLEVSGTISSIELDMNDEPMVSLEGGGMFEEVTLHFGSSYAEQTSQLSRGQQFTARCSEIAEIMGFPQLMGCKPVVQTSANEIANENQNIENLFREGRIDEVNEPYEDCLGRWVNDEADAWQVTLTISVDATEGPRVTYDASDEPTFVVPFTATEYGLLFPYRETGEQFELICVEGDVAYLESPSNGSEIEMYYSPNRQMR